MSALDFPRGAVVRLTLPLPPVLNHYYRAVRGKVVVSEKGKDYRKRLWDSHGYGHHLPLLGLVAVKRLTFFAKNQDIDAGFKALFDALQGIAWLDDRQIRIIERVELHLDEGEVDPRVNLEAEGAEFATLAQVRADRKRREAIAEKGAKTRAKNRAAQASGMLERAQARAKPVTLRPNVVLPLKRGPAPLETHMSDCLVLYGKGASCTCGAVRR